MEIYLFDLTGTDSNDEPGNNHGVVSCHWTHVLEEGEQGVHNVAKNEEKYCAKARPSVNAHHPGAGQPDMEHGG